jgi:hypothetical protein
VGAVGCDKTYLARFWEIEMANNLRIVGIILVVFAVVMMVFFRDAADGLRGFGPGISLLSAGIVVLISSRRVKSR